MEQNAANEIIKLYAKQLRLPSFNKYAKVVQQLEPNESYADFLLKLMKTELDDRQHTAQEKRIKTAKFPTKKKRSMNLTRIGWSTSAKAVSESCRPVISSANNRT